MTGSASVPAYRRGRTRVLLMAAAVGVVGAILVTSNTFLELPLIAISPLLIAPLLGVSLFIPVLALALLRRPLMGLFASVVAGLVAMPFTGFLFFIPLSGAIHGVVAEAPVAVGRYRRWGVWRFAVSALIMGIVELAIHWQLWSIDRMVGGLQLAAILLFVASQFLWMGIALAVARGLRRAGVGEIDDHAPAAR